MPDSETKPAVTQDPAAIAGKLSAAQKAAMRVSLPCWFAGSSVGLRNGNTLSVLADKGLFERRSDPETWGRSQYRLTPLGLSVRQILEEQDRGE